MTKTTNNSVIIHRQHVWAVLFKHPINTSSQPPAFTIIHASRCDNYKLDWCVQATRLREIESKKTQWNVSYWTQVLVQVIENFEWSKVRELVVNLLCFIKYNNGMAVLLWEVENFERSEFEPSRVTCINLIILESIYWRNQCASFVGIGHKVLERRNFLIPPVHFLSICQYTGNRSDIWKILHSE